MSLASMIAARFRRPSATVTIAGRRWSGVLRITKREEFGQSVESVTIEGRDPPISPAAGQAVIVKWGYNGFEVSAFTGDLSSVVRKSYPNTWTIEARGLLYRAQRVQQDIAGGAPPYNDILASDAAEYILSTYAGITRMNIPDFPAAGSEWVGSEWTMGRLTPVFWARSTALAAVQEICSVLGYWLYADTGGVVRAINIERRPSDSPFRTFRRGVDLLVQGAPERQTNPDSVRNRVEVLGANTGVAGAQIKDARQTSHPLLPAGVYQTLNFSSTLIEYVNASQAGAASAESVAARILNVWSREPNIIRARIKADPRLAVGVTIGIEDEKIGYNSRQNFFIYAIDSSLDLTSGAFDQNLVLDGGTGDQGYTTIPPPIAAFTWRLVSETINGDAVIDVFLDGSGSYSQSEGLIVSWAWSTTATPYTGTPSSGAGESFSLVFLASEATAEITLTVTDTTSKTGTLTQTITLAGDGLSNTRSRALSIAFGSAWVITPDGGETLNTEASGDAVAVGVFGPGVDIDSIADSSTYGPIATRAGSGTGLRTTADLLVSASTNLASLGAAITMVWVNERNPARVWAAVGLTVRRSIDGGATFTTWGTLPAAVAWIIEDPSVDNSVFVFAGDTVYHSTAATAPGTSWAILFAGQPGATGRHMVRSRDGAVTWLCYSDSDVVERIEGGSFTIAGAGGVRALALAPTTDNRIYAFDDQRRIIWADADTGSNQATSTQTYPTGAIVQHAIYDHEYPIIYTADFDSVVSGTGAVRKYLPESDRLLEFIDGQSGQQAHQVGLAVRSIFTQGANIILVPWAGAGGADFIFVFNQELGIWQTVAPPQAGWYWQCCRVSPFNTDEWLLLGNTNTTGQCDIDSGVVVAAGTNDSPLYYSNDAGTTWSPITLNHPWESGSHTAGPLSKAVLLDPGLVWSDSLAGWVLYGYSHNLPAQGYTGWVWRGVGSTTPATPGYETNNAFGTLAPGQSGDAVFTMSDISSNIRLRYFPAAGGAAVNPPGGSMVGLQQGRIDREPGSRRVAMAVQFSNFFVTSDYRAAQPGFVAGGASSQFQWATHGLYGCSPQSPARIDPSTGANTVISSLATGGALCLATDRQTRSLVVFQILTDGSGPILIYDGSTGTLLPKPAAGTNLNQASIEVFVRLI